MRRYALLAAIAAGATVLLFLEPIADQITIVIDNDGAYLSALAAAVALGVAILALSLSAWAIRNAYHLRSDIAQLSRSLDRTLHEIDERSDRNSKTIGEINFALKCEIAAIADAQQALPQDNNPLAVSSHNGAGRLAENVIPHPSVRKSTAQEADSSDRQSSGFANSRREIESAVSKVSGKEGPELSLQPIVSIFEGRAKGFEVFAHLRLPNDRFVDVQRLISPTAGMNVAGFERGIILAATRAARQQLGDDAFEMPLHCAISSALLDDPEELTAVAELFDIHAALARSLVLSVPANLFLSGKSGRLEMLETLSEVGIRFAVENWQGTVADAAVQRNAGARYIKQPATRLLGLEKTGRQTLDTDELVEAVLQADLEIIATDVTSDEAAIGLIDSGVDLLTGARFGDPKLLRGPTGDDSGSVVRA